MEPFSIPHDAADPVGYRLWGGRTSVSTATDLGVFTEDVYASISGSTLVLTAYIVNNSSYTIFHGEFILIST